MYVFIGRPRDVKDRPDGLMVIHNMTFNADHELNWIETPGYFFPVKLGESEYLQCTDVSRSNKITKWDQASVKAYEFVKYQVADGRLTLWFMDKDATKKAIEDGVLKGTVKETNTITSPAVTLTEATEGLHRYFATDHSMALFPEKTKLTLERVR